MDDIAYLFLFGGVGMALLLPLVTLIVLVRFRGEHSAGLGNLHFIKDVN